MMRIHITNPTGVGEWVSLTPEVVRFRAPTIVNDIAHVAFSLTEAAQVDLIVYDAVGRKCMTLINSRLPAGDFQKTFTLDLPAGVYFYNLKTGPEAGIVRKFLLVR